MRLLFLFLSFQFFSFISFGQPPDRIRAKIILGVMGAQIDGDQLGGYNKPGLIAGMAMEMKLGKKFSVQPEMMYNQKGARSTDRSLYYAIMRLNYLDLCGLLNFYVKNQFVLQGGGSYGLLYKARVDRGSGFITDNSFFNSSDLCLLFGAEFKFSPKGAVSIRHGYSVKSISPVAYWYNNTISFSLRFTLGKYEESSTHPPVN